MAQKKLLTIGNAFQRTDKRWCGVVWFMDEHGERKRKSFSGTTKAEVNKKIKDYVAAFDKMVIESDESKKTLKESMGNWLRVFKFPSVERGSYDRLECTAKHQVYPLLGKKVVGNVTSADIQKLLNHWMNEGYAYNTVKKVYNLLTDYFRHLTQQELIQKNPMVTVPMIKKANFTAAQGRKNPPTFETVTTFTPEEIDKFKNSIRHTFATNLVNGIRQPDGTIKSLSPRQVADLLGHSTSEITELYYVRKDTSRLNGITEGFEL